MTPSAAANPKALPPDKHTACTWGTRFRGSSASVSRVPGATDGTVLTARTGMPTVVYGPGGKWIAHQVDEFVEVSAVIEAAEVYREAALRFASGAPH